MKKCRKKILYGAGIVFLSLLSLVGVGLSYWFQHPQKNKQVVVLIEKGASLFQISSQLSQKGVLDNPFLFKGILYVTRQWPHLKAGEYLIPAQVTPAHLIHVLKSGNGVLHPLTLVEGETSYQLVQKLLKDDRFQGPCAIPPEGSLLPQTYRFPRGMKRETIIAYMQKAMERELSEAWEQCAKDHPLTSPEKLLVVASLVEKETSLPQERPLVAAVFLNRFKVGMPLQADPTVVYALTRGEGALGRALCRKDLGINNPYNTYCNPGLPPSPIANPSAASLKAVAQPASVDYLYFVADGKGGHVFSKTLKEHQKNHACWRKIRAKKKANGAK